MPLTLDDVTWPLVTPRLEIRRAAAEDAAEVWAYRRLPAVAEWMIRLEDELEPFTQRFVDPERMGPTLVVHHDGRLVGDLMVRQEDVWAQHEVADLGRGATAEIGWAFDPAVGGRGFATEAARAAVRLCFETLGLHRVSAICFTDNTPSWRLMERLGMRREAHAVGESLHRSGGWLDSYTYALLRTEWDKAMRAEGMRARD
ncbi:N-acetyltransferase [Serinibacter arcticus]|uniref:N-acetyltransferase n=1 Tax=Serinibacter arcticus TaxID=1655435 RepID=A0A2U1ZSQ0_9MICO|nr:GNAT family protein [Serinibacter arcticus]PWD50014.1 N-acetyltransferase [Serinibacter arcticus]